MSEAKGTRTFDPMGDVLEDTGMGTAGVLSGKELMMANQARPGETHVQVLGAVVTAVRVAVPRDIAAIMAEIKALAARAGSRWVYRIPFKNKGKGTTDWVEGATVKCTNSVFRTYGNCHLTTQVSSEGDSWIFYSRIVDLQKGTTYDRPFQQRRAQDTGMADKARATDLVFQIGVSKSQRNVVANFLEDLVAYAVEEAKRGVLDRVKNNPDGARAWILAQLQELEIDVVRVAGVYGRTPDHWTVFDMAKMFGELNGIEDGMVDPADIYPVPMTPEQRAEQSNKTGDGNPIATRKRAEKKDETKKDPDPQRSDVGTTGQQGAATQASTTPAADPLGIKDQTNGQGRPPLESFAGTTTSVANTKVEQQQQPKKSEYNPF